MEFCPVCKVQMIGKPAGCTIHGIPTAGLTEAAVRKFETGATRDTDENKLKYLGFLSQPVLKRYAEYLHENRKQKDGTFRDPDNWKKGIPLPVYMDSSLRHFMERWEHFLEIEQTKHDQDELQCILFQLEQTLCAEMFNTMGMLHEILKLRR